MLTLSSFRHIHQDSAIIVCGCGVSLNELTNPEHFITIGVNDVGRLFNPNYLVVVDQRERFKGDRFAYVEQSKADYLFTQLDLGIPHNNIVKFALGGKGGTDFSDPNRLHYSTISPYVALCLALHMGARLVGLIGVDFQDHHFWGQTGEHPQVCQLRAIDDDFRRLDDAARRNNIQIFNLSEHSRLTAFRKMAIKEFSALCRPKSAETQSGQVGESQDAVKRPVAEQLGSIVQNRYWTHYLDPFPHIRATNVFKSEFYRSLEAEFRHVLRLGLTEDRDDPVRFSRNMSGYDAYSWNFPPDLTGPLALFYSRAWHDALAALVGIACTGDVNGALHHHTLRSASGQVHSDLAVCWYSIQPRRDKINPMDLSRCSYTDGRRASESVPVREVVRAVTMIFFLNNARWLPGMGGETGLYLTRYDRVDSPSAVVAPVNNSILIFENTPYSYHSFLSNRRHPRNSVILWLHRGKDEVLGRWGPSCLDRWQTGPMES